LKTATGAPDLLTNSLFAATNYAALSETTYSTLVGEDLLAAINIIITTAGETGITSVTTQLGAIDVLFGTLYGCQANDITGGCDCGGAYIGPAASGNTPCQDADITTDLIDEIEKWMSPAKLVPDSETNSVELPWFLSADLDALSLGSWDGTTCDAAGDCET